MPLPNNPKLIGLVPAGEMRDTMQTSSDVESIMYSAARSGPGQRRIVCPFCATQRKRMNQTSKTMSLKIDNEGYAYTCWHCSASGGERFDHTIPRGNPVSKPQTVAVLSEDGLSYLLTKRGISHATSMTAGLFQESAWIREAQGEIPCVGFPYFDERGTRTGAKLRAIKTKGFTMQGQARAFFGQERLVPGEPIVICEGEIDALSITEAGIVNGVSVPHGAPPAAKPGAAPSDANDKRLECVWNARGLLQGAPKVIIAVDNDAPGEALAEELARRIGKAKCWRVRWPDGIKDANEFLLTHGAADLCRYVEDNAEAWPLSGVHQASDFRTQLVDLYDKGLSSGLGTGWDALDPYLSISPGMLYVVTGIPGSGKSTWLDALLMNVTRDYGWKGAIASFENPIPIHLAKFVSLYTGKPFAHGKPGRADKQEIEDALDWIDDHMMFLAQDGEPPTVANIIDRLTAAVQRMGVRWAVIDPFNFIKLSTDGQMMSETSSINEMLAAFKVFATTHDIALFLVAHPSKPPSSAGNDWVPSGYNISGSANWYNRADFGITVQRLPHSSKVHVWKCRFTHLGKIGSEDLVFQPDTGRYFEANDPAAFDDLEF